MFVLNIRIREMTNDGTNSVSVGLAYLATFLGPPHFTRSNHLHSTGNFLCATDTIDFGFDFFSDCHNLAFHHFGPTMSAQIRNYQV